MAAGASNHDVFQWAHIDPNEDNDILSMCNSLAQDTMQAEPTILRSHSQEPGAILPTTNGLADSIHTACPDWPPALKRLALGALVMHKKRFATDVGIHEHVEILHVLCGHFDDLERQQRFGAGQICAHNGSTHTIFDGSWRRHQGVISEGLLCTLKESLLALEGLFVCLDAAKSTASTNQTLLRDIQRVCDLCPMPATTTIEKFIEYLMDQARFQKKSEEESLKFKVVAEHLKKWCASLQTELMNKKIFEMYGAWCSTEKKAADGACWRDCCGLFTPDGIRFVSKSASNNVYIYIDTPLLDPVIQIHMDRLAKIHSTTYWKNKAALRCEFSAFCLALMRKNIDRGFWHLGRGGAGQSLTTSHIHALMSGFHAFLDMNIYFTDDEMRKQADLLIDMLVSTGQETVQGATTSLRFDLMKKHLSGDPIAMRLLYSIITKMESLIGWTRFECNVLPCFQGVTEQNFNSVLRRGWVMQMLATFVEKRVYDTIENPESKGVFLKDPNARDFVVSSPAVGAGWKIMHGWMTKYSEKQCYEEIENYVDGADKGLTRKSLRFACGLPVDAPVAPIGPPPDPIHQQQSELQKESDELVGFLLENDLEYMTESQCRLATCLTGGNATDRKERFQTLISHGYWKSSVKPQGNAGQTYIPMLRTMHGIGSVFPQVPFPAYPDLPEQLSVDGLRQSHSNEARLHNVGVYTKHLQFQMKYLHSKQRMTKEEKNTLYEVAKSLRKIETRERTLKQTVKHCDTLLAGGQQCMAGTLSVHTKYKVKYDRMCRASPESHGYAGMSKILQQIANQHIDEFDQESAQWSLLSQIVDRVQPKLNHPVAKVDAIRQYRNDKDVIFHSLSTDPATAKLVCLRTLNGASIAPEYVQNEFLQAVRKEGRFLRWLASSLDPTFHSQIIAEGEKQWPEATTMFYLWSAPEAWCTSVMARYGLTFGPKHLSLHCDAVKIGKDDYNIPAGAFIKQAQDHILAETGYAITVVKKDALFALSVFKQKQQADSPNDEACDDILLKEGNCIASAVYFAMQRPGHIINDLKKLNVANRKAAVEGTRTYRSCQQLGR